MDIDGYAVARRIQRLMRAFDLNQKQLATKLNITQPAVSKYLQGRIPPADVLLHIAHLTEVSMEWILTGTDSQISRKVAEPGGNYLSVSRLEDKLERLPPQVRDDFEQLIDSLRKFF